MRSLADNLNSGYLDYEIIPLMENPDPFCKGGNARHLLLAVWGENGAEQLDFLEKVMNAVTYNVARDAILFSLTYPAPFSFKKMEKGFHFERAVFFGVKPQDAGLKLEVQPYQPLSVSGTTYLFCHSLKKIQADPALKRQLWEALKAMFLN